MARDEATDDALGFLERMLQGTLGDDLGKRILLLVLKTRGEQIIAGAVDKLAPYLKANAAAVNAAIINALEQP